jgi:CDP-diacylglycerol--glycerol-3-phosphate 3-phosphatidyltransferase
MTPSARPEKRIWTVPNVLTVFRLACLFPILVFLSRGERWPAVAFSVLGVAFDFLDGIIARRFHQASDLGRMLDPFVDKVNVLSVGLFMVLSPLYDFPAWYFVFLAARELGVLAGGLWLVRRRRKVPEANVPGKRSAFFTGMCILLYMLGWQPYAKISLWFAFGLALYSTAMYGRVFLDSATEKDAGGRDA